MYQKLKKQVRPYTTMTPTGSDPEFRKQYGVRSADELGQDQQTSTPMTRTSGVDLLQNPANIAARKRVSQRGLSGVRTK